MRSLNPFSGQILGTKMFMFIKNMPITHIVYSLMSNSASSLTYFSSAERTSGPDDDINLQLLCGHCNTIKGTAP